MAMKRLAWVAMLAACGSEEPGGEQMQIVVPFHAAAQLQQPCTDPQMSGLEARLWIGGGYPPCDLSVAADFSASGICSGITVGIVRPLMIEYFVRVAAVDRQVAYNIGFVDLRRENIDDEARAVPAALDGVRSHIVYLESEVAGLAAGPSAGDLGTAESWSVSGGGDPGPIPGELMSLECDPAGDACSNLEEACRGILDCVTVHANCP